MLVGAGVLILFCRSYLLALGSTDRISAKFIAGLLVLVLTGTGIFAVSRELLISDGGLDSVLTEPATPEPISDLAQHQLAEVHEETVRVFIGRLVFGHVRMPIPTDINDVVKGLQSEPPKISDETLEYLFDFPALEKGETKATNIHPAMKNFPEVWNTDDAHSANKLTQWTIKDLKLIGLSKNPTPIVYLTDRVPSMSERKKVPTRELDEFERTARVENSTR